MKTWKKLLNKNRLLIFVLVFALTCCGVCKAIDSNLLLIFISTGGKYLHIDGLKIEKYQDRTITVENAEALARLLVEYNITNLNLQNLRFYPGALLIILKVFNNGYFTFKNCYLDRGGVFALLDYYTREKERKKIIFDAVGIEFMLDNVLQQIDLTTISSDSETEKNIKQIVLGLFSENVSRLVLNWFNERRTFGNNSSVIATSPSLLTTEEEQTRARRLQTDVEEERLNSSSYSATASTLLPIQEIPKNNIMQRNGINNEIRISSSALPAAPVQQQFVPTTPAIIDNYSPKNSNNTNTNNEISVIAQLLSNSLAQRETSSKKGWFSGWFAKGDFDKKTQ